MTAPRRGLTSSHGTSYGDEHWATRGACNDYDPELWYTIGRDAAAMADKAEAKRICVTECPVRDLCLQKALKSREPCGIWGGYDEDERKGLARGQRKTVNSPVQVKAATPKPKAKKRNLSQELHREADHARALRHRQAGTEPPCGTRAGYHHHRALHEPYCGECRAYRSNAAAAERDRTRTQSDEPTPQAAANAARRTRAHEARATLAAHIEDLIEIGADFDRATRETGYRRDTLERLLYRAQRPDLIAKLKRAA